MTDVRAVLELGRQRISRAWAKGAMKQPLPGGRVAYCAIGAVDQNREACMILAQFVPQDTIVRFDCGVPGCTSCGKIAATPASVMAYNDFGSTTLADVLDMFDKAIASLGGTTFAKWAEEPKAEWKAEHVKVEVVEKIEHVVKAAAKAPEYVALTAPDPLEETWNLPTVTRWTRIKNRLTRDKVDA